MSAKRVIVAGEVFGRLTVLCPAKSKGTDSCSRCRCECGKSVVVRNYCLRNGHTRSCGCLNREETGARFRKHGKSGSKLYDVWSAMRKRCENPEDPAYDRYGGRGITVCERWKDFTAFYEDMGDRPSDRHSIERVDNAAGYSKENCRWALAVEQVKNRRNTRRLTIGGETKTIAEWCSAHGANYYVVYRRLRSGWDATAALTTAPKQRTT
jgi:hypothetical protein